MPEAKSPLPSKQACPPVLINNLSGPATGVACFQWSVAGAVALALLK